MYFGLRMNRSDRKHTIIMFSLLFEANIIEKPIFGEILKCYAIAFVRQILIICVEYNYIQCNYDFPGQTCQTFFNRPEQMRPLAKCRQLG